MSKARGKSSWLFSKKREPCGKKAGPVNPRAEELQTAKEILAEVFSIRTEEAEKMIRTRCEEGLRLGDMWPDRLWVE
jgi:hypothetical protein